MLNSRSAVPHVITRYSNRKLYDPQSSRYVTLDDLKQLVREGAELRVEDAASGEDVTSLTLMQILLESERAHQAALPSTLLHQLIKQGETWYELLSHLMRTSPVDQLPLGPADVERFWNQWATSAGWRSPTEPRPVAGPAGHDTPSTNLERELAALKEKLLALEKRVPPKTRRAVRRRTDRRVSGRRR